MSKHEYPIFQYTACFDFNPLVSKVAMGADSPFSDPNGESMGIYGAW